MKETKLGNYFGYYKGHYIFIYRRPHGMWCCRVGKAGVWLFSEGYFGTFLQTIKQAEKWAADKVNSIL